MTIDEYKGHFAIWAITKSPLLIGCDIPTMSDDVHKILTSKEVIAINQDSLGVAGDVVYHEGANIIYAGPLADGSRAVVLWNRHTHDNAPEDHWGVDEHCEEGQPCNRYPANGKMNAYNITVTWDRIGISAHAPALVRDLYEEEDLGVYTGEFTHLVKAHGAMVLKVTPLRKRDRDTSWRPWQTNQISQPDEGSTEQKSSLNSIALAVVLALIATATVVAALYRTIMERRRSSGYTTIDIPAPPDADHEEKQTSGSKGGATTTIDFRD